MKLARFLIVFSLSVPAVMSCKNMGGSGDRFFSGGNQNTIANPNGSDAQGNSSKFNPEDVGEWMVIPKDSPILKGNGSTVNINTIGDNYKDGYKEGFADGRKEALGGENGTDPKPTPSPTATPTPTPSPTASPTPSPSNGDPGKGGSSDATDENGEPLQDSNIGPDDEAKLCWCAGGASGDLSIRGRAVNILSSMEDAKACAAKIAKPSPFTTKPDDCVRYASYGRCECTGFPVPWSVTPAFPEGRAGDAACQCLHGNRDIKPAQYPTWVKPIRWDMEWQ